MVKHELMIIANYSQDTSLSLGELCEICNISPDILNDFIAYEIIHPKHPDRDQWMFDLAELKRVKRALRLQRELELNLTAVAVVLDLLDQIEELRDRAEFLQRHF
jgi:chaperone modulatory protein CbpM